MSGLIWVRATVHLPGVHLGEEVQVDPSNPYIAERLAVGYLQRTGRATRDEEPVVEDQGEVPSPPEPSEAPEAA